MSLDFYELCCIMEADSMSEEWSWKNFARGAALGAAAGAAGLGLAGGINSSGPPKSSKTPSALASPDTGLDDIEKERQDKYKQRLKSLRTRRLDREPELTPAQRTQRPQRNPDKVTSNFGWGEFMSKDGSPLPDEYKPNILELAKNLEVLRDAVGGVPISLTSGYRSPEHNSNVGGEKNSQHLLGKAADIRISGLSPQEVASLIEKLIKDGKMKEGGIGIYPNQGFVHYDIRGTKARWPKDRW
jgi:hypothetical protein